ncbi:hypothetical protein F7725_020703 [Dissostichus mawsoni]|uniref:Uncharacterized protein n=1 Tax=Dissostichus mawsoni TaxID=36200 RepID=A0A7J5YE05_DISMA|nr:hypothetical protein F7725_020703 [Dissostichus mawsoni]
MPEEREGEETVLENHHLERPNTVPAANQPKKTTRLITDCISQNALEVMEALQTLYCRYMPVLMYQYYPYCTDIDVLKSSAVSSQI